MEATPHSRPQDPAGEAPARVTVPDLQQMKDEGRRITMLTAYDWGMARLVDEAGVDVVLVGDSLGMVVLGYDATTPVTMDEMLHHAKAVRRGVRRALVVGDMPFLSYQVSREEAVRNAGRFLKEAGCGAVKVEGGGAVVETVRFMTAAGIPVMGHLGLTPQTAAATGGFRVRGRDLASARRLVADAADLEAAGAFALVLECVPAALARLVTERLRIPTIGIGAGPGCDGQVLVVNDVVGLFDRFRPSFVKRYAELAPTVRAAVGEYVADVREGRFPDEAHSFTGEPPWLADLRAELEAG
ncbi:3-methyl-2-oxobutanoate hydroxymethyltransferase [Dissulfurirhabdus thermomarina]|uniref:3-methyl-2-oxobutanoate hydroxymethyltransferase n=1 Tax=Dissulfurirhabdus thermomarina TaxID=1765737 RepID=A0A6N9TPU5_DISTH|nr:3-methyl-2-oxobutanoate hydroxymethyltransferase [Dissulfurirhabdus thermomarina]NDY42123.1 3-methyl-2-oxobutanoate hydroxymethyltransferase [Dissulfurirhabdus thermomarina]NMX23134.1 3-methyl-2-oxobutanoate hydroxymethyltransferase [Dissulfurirhabdus thermomarina]